MEVYRLSREEFARPLSGAGAALKGGRWNSPGIELVYTAANRSLAMAEVAVHMSVAVIPNNYVMAVMAIPESLLLEVISEKNLPAGWNAFPYTLSTRRYGDEFVRTGTSCLLKVPSAVTKGDFNILLNPHHPDFRKITISSIEPFPFDKRIFR